MIEKNGDKILLELSPLFLIYIVLNVNFSKKPFSTYNEYVIILFVFILLRFKVKDKIYFKER